MRHVAFFPKGSEDKHDLVYVENIVHGLLLTEEKLKENSPVAGEVRLN